MGRKHPTVRQRLRIFPNYDRKLPPLPRDTRVVKAAAESDLLLPPTTMRPPLVAGAEGLVRAVNELLAVAQFTVNASRFDPYKGFKFRVKWDGQVIAGVDRISALRRETEVVVHRDGNEPSLQRRSPGVTTYEPIVLSRGRTHDTAFEEWANKVWNHGATPGSEVSLKDFRKDVYIELLNEAGQVVLAWKVFRCWVSEYVALPDLDAGASAVAIEQIKLENEGWERDTSVTEPVEPSFDAP